MKPKQSSPSILIFIIFMVIAVVVVIFLTISNVGKSFSSPGAGNIEGNYQAAASETNEDGKSPDEVSGVGSNYEIYRSGAVEENTDKRRVLFFYANWCPVCQPVDKELREKADTLPDDVVVIRVNYNDSDTDGEEKQLANRYGITYQHTFVTLDSEGNALEKWNGGGLAEILEKV